MKTSKINGWQPILTKEGQHRSVDGKYGKIYYFRMVMENGDEGSAPNKNAVPENWDTTSEWEYTIEEFNGFQNFKQLRKKGSWNGAKQVVANASPTHSHTALNCATQFIRARIESGKEHNSNDVIVLAEKMKKWLEKQDKQ